MILKRKGRQEEQAVPSLWFSHHSRALAAAPFPPQHMLPRFQSAVHVAEAAEAGPRGWGHGPA